MAELGHVRRPVQPHGPPPVVPHAEVQVDVPRRADDGQHPGPLLQRAVRRRLFRVLDPAAHLHRRLVAALGFLQRPVDARVADAGRVFRLARKRQTAPVRKVEPVAGLGCERERIPQAVTGHLRLRRRLNRHVQLPAVHRHAARELPPIARLDAVDHRRRRRLDDVRHLNGGIRELRAAPPRAPRFRIRHDERTVHSRKAHLQPPVPDLLPRAVGQLDAIGEHVLARDERERPAVLLPAGEIRPRRLLRDPLHDLARAAQPREVKLGGECPLATRQGNHAPAASAFGMLEHERAGCPHALQRNGLAARARIHVQLPRAFRERHGKTHTSAPFENVEC